MIDIGASFDKTLNKYGISATWLSRESGVNAQMISRFRNGKEVQTDTLEKLLEPLPIEAKQYFSSLITGQPYQLEVDIEQVIEQLDGEEFDKAWAAMSEKVTTMCKQIRSRRTEEKERQVSQPLAS